MNKGGVFVNRGSLVFPSFRHSSVHYGNSTVAGILNLEGVPESVWGYIRVSINNLALPQSAWGFVRPKPGAIVSIGICPGNSDTTGLIDKGNLRLLGFLASTVAGSAVGSLVGGPWGTVLSTALSILGIFLSSTFISPPNSAEEYSSATLSGAQNKFRQYGTIPRVYGKIRVYPDLCAVPVTEICGEDQYLNLLFCVGYGPLKLSALKIGEVPISEYKEITLAIANGWGINSRVDADGDPVGLYSSGMDVSETNYDKDLLYAASWYVKSSQDFEERPARGSVRETTELNENVVTYITQEDTVRFGLDLVFPDGLYNTTSDGSVQSERVDISIRYRPYGATGGDSWMYVYPSWLAQNLTEEVNTITDSGLFQLLVDARALIEEIIPVLDGISSLDRIMAASLRAYFVGRIFGIRAAIQTLLGSDVYTNDELLELGQIDTQLLDLSEQIDNSADVLDNFSTTLGQFNEVLSGIIVVLEFIDDSLALHEYVRRGAGPELSSLRPLHRWMIKKRNLERLFGPPVSGAFIVVNEEVRPGLFRRGVSVETLTGQYEVQVRRTNEVYEDDNVHNDAQIGNMRSFADHPPVSASVMSDMTIIAMRIKASDQLTGTLEQFNLIAESPLPYYTNEWKSRALVDGSGNPVSKNPAWIALDMLKGSACIYPVADANIDLTTFVAFASHCQTKKLFFSGIFDTMVTVEDALQDVFRVAKASLTLSDGKFSVVYDHEQVGFEGLITVRNTDQSFSATKVMTPAPDAVRIKFIDADKGYEQNEWIVYQDGFGPTNVLIEVDRFLDGGASLVVPFAISTVTWIKDTISGLMTYDNQNIVSIVDGVSYITREDGQEWGEGTSRFIVRFKYQGATPVNVEELDIPGLVDTYNRSSSEHTGQVYQLGRYLLASATLRPEVFTVAMDREHKLLRRGSRVKLEHDVIKWGHGAARITGNIVTQSGSLVSFDVDETVTMESGKLYALHLRTHTNKHLSGLLVTTVGSSNALVLSPHMGLDGETIVGDELVAYGEVDTATIPCLVTSISKTKDGGANITLVEDHPAVHNAENVIIPDYDPRISNPPEEDIGRPNPPIIISINTDESVLQQLPNGQLKPRMVISLSLGVVEETNKRSDFSNIVAIDVQYRPSISFSSTEHIIVGATSDLSLGEKSWTQLPLFTQNLSLLTISDVQQGQRYDVRIRGITGLGVASEWATSDGVLVIGKLSAPPDVRNLRLNGNTLQWDYPSVPLDFAGFIVKQVYGYGGTWEIASAMHDGYVTSSSFTLPAAIGRNRKLFVKAVDMGGIESINAAILIADLGVGSIGTPIDTISHSDLGWPGDKYKFSVESGSVLTETEEDDGCFYRNDGGGLPFYIGGVPFYQRTYPGGVYSFDLDPSAYTTPFFLTIDMEGSGDECLVQMKITDPIVIGDVNDMIFPPSGLELFFPYNRMNWSMVNGAIQVHTNEIIDFRIVSCANDTQTILTRVDVVISS